MGWLKLVSGHPKGDSLLLLLVLLSYSISKCHRPFKCSIVWTDHPGTGKLLMNMKGEGFLSLFPEDSKSVLEREGKSRIGRTFSSQRNAFRSILVPLMNLRIMKSEV